jgi:hypothetical protein
MCSCVSACLRVCVYGHGRVYARWRVQVRARIDISMRDSLYARMYVRTCMRGYKPICVDAPMCAFTNACMCVCAYVRMHVRDVTRAGV